jgi:protein TonB
MPLPYALALSLALHAAILFPFAQRPPPPPVRPPLEVQLPPPPEVLPLPDVISTEPAPSLSAPNRTTSQPALSSRRATQRAQTALAKFLMYPEEAIVRGLEGETVLLLNLDPTGRILRAEIARSSGHAILDQAALSAAQRIGTLPGNPAQTLLPVAFRLQ